METKGAHDEKIPVAAAGLNGESEGEAIITKIPPPLIGFGMAEYPFGASSSETIRDAVVHAIRLGYRHFDTAALYQTEVPLGEGISEALRLGLVNSREELFVTSKLWCNDAHPHLVLPALQNTLKNLKLEYLDLYLIHWPVSLRGREIELPLKKEDLVAMDFKSVWEAMEECKKLGLAKSIGVSNFSCKKLQDLLATAKIPPAVNQVSESEDKLHVDDGNIDRKVKFEFSGSDENENEEKGKKDVDDEEAEEIYFFDRWKVEINPVWQQKKLREFCKEKGIHITAYSPLGAKGTLWGSNRVMDCQLLKDIAFAKGKTIAQVCIRWVYEQGVSVLVKSFNKERMEENLDIFDWELTPQDLDMIDQIPQQKGYPAAEFISDNGPYKSLEEVWDGEI